MTNKNKQIEDEAFGKLLDSLDSNQMDLFKTYLNAHHKVINDIIGVSEK